MKQVLQKSKEASEGLLYRSESDYPFEVVHLQATSSTLEKELVLLSNKGTETKVEQGTLEYFSGIW